MENMTFEEYDKTMSECENHLCPVPDVIFIDTDEDGLCTLIVKDMF